MAFTMNNWADFRWWVGFLLPILFGLRPLKEWLKHRFSFLWPQEEDQVTPLLNPQLITPTNEQVLEPFAQMRTGLQQLTARDDALRKLLTDLDTGKDALERLLTLLKEREGTVEQLLTSLRQRETVLSDREEALRRREEDILRREGQIAHVVSEAMRGLSSVLEPHSGR
ncbi:uncharacterized protein LDX57_005140 [Aspergillus melleus]|uniref:uncharacterized protein n=1 Tax=Aspergillus melleus TaxID=138277 RepID=UPI001E8E6F25|nr:uncharacterized protein LDX57_005140 [Aspergillus melleus]KAH8427426.1 hypothetical protein LDX57_005140 [Aspergillus melleus]